MKNKIQKVTIVCLFFAVLVLIFFPLFTEAPKFEIKSGGLLAVPSTELPLPTGPLTVRNQESCNCECNNDETLAK